MNAGTTQRWLIQAGLGILLVILLGVHLTVNHWVAPQGLLSYADIVHYYDVPGIAWMESIFLIVVVAHCLLGMHSILLDLNLRPNLARTLTWFLVVAGLMAILYGIWLVGVVRTVSVSP